MKIFKSKRNNVYLKNGKVYKVHLNIHDAIIEADILTCLYNKQVPVPKVDMIKDNMIIMEYIDGIPLPDLLALEEKVPFDILGYDICHWLGMFYLAMNSQETSIIRGDVNGRNFLYRDSIIGVDFEGMVYGSIETDIGKLIAFLETYDDLDVVYITRLTTYIKQKGMELWSLTGKNIEFERKRELAAMSKRRG